MMILSRRSTLTLFGLTLAAVVMMNGCGGSTPEIDSAEVIQKEAPKPADAATPKPTPETPVAKEAPKG